jgi:hypothetical protein
MTSQPRPTLLLKIPLEIRYHIYSMLIGTPCSVFFYCPCRIPIHKFQENHHQTPPTDSQIPIRDLQAAASRDSRLGFSIFEFFNHKSFRNYLSSHHQFQNSLPVCDGYGGVLVGLQGSCILILDPDRFDLTIRGCQRLFSWTRTTL